jgi:hypothetical protein
MVRFTKCGLVQIGLLHFEIVWYSCPDVVVSRLCYLEVSNAVHARELITLLGSYIHKGGAKFFCML